VAKNKSISYSLAQSSLLFSVAKFSLRSSRLCGEKSYSASSAVKNSFANKIKICEICVICGSFFPAAAVTASVLSPGDSDTTYYSSNWAGYADLASTGQTFSSVVGQWVVPTITPPSGGTYSSSSYPYTATWVGLDGFSSSTVEQTGTAAYFTNNTVSYYAWYELYPKNLTPVSLTIEPGNLMSASVTYAATNKYTLTIEDVTTGKSFSTTQTSSGDARSSAEWIAEAPTSSLSGVLPLANFGSVTFTAASSTLNGDTGSISAFTNDAIDLEASTGHYSATTSYLNSSGNSFTVTVTPQPSSLYWAGGASGVTGDQKTWDIGFNQNWINGSTDRTTYLDGAAVDFNDSGAPNYNVALNTVVHPGSVTVNNSAGNFVISGSGSIAGSAGLVKTGSDSLTLSVADSFTGGTTIQKGTLIVGNSSAVPTDTGVSFGDASGDTGTLDLGGIGAAVASLAVISGGHGIITNNGGPGSSAATLTFAGGSGTFGGAITNGSSQTALAVNSGVLTLNGTLAYTGNTTINSGTLALSGTATIASPLITVQSGGIFNVSSLSAGFTLGSVAAQEIDGNGDVTGNVIVGADGTLSPGNGTLSIGSLTIGGNVNMGGTFAAQVTATSGTNDQLVAGGNVTLGGNETLSSTGTLTNGESFTDIQGNVYGSFSGVTLPTLNAGLSWNTPLNINNSIAGASNTYQQNYTYSVTNGTPVYSAVLPASDTYAGLNIEDQAAGSRNTTVTFLGGTVSKATTVSASFANRTGSNPYLISDVATISGTNSDTYVLELNYIAADVSNGTLSPVLAVQNAQGVFQTAVLFNTSDTAHQEVTGSYTSADDILGDYGVDPLNDQVWAVLDYSNGDQFGIYQRIPGDLTGIGTVTPSDLGLVQTNLDRPTGGLWSNGDFQGSGNPGDLVTPGDLALVQSNYLFSVEPAGSSQGGGGGLITSSPVPEPGSLALLAVGAMGMLLRKKKCSSGS
jgi:autotransporter-associated beta strand protein